MAQLSAPFNKNLIQRPGIIIVATKSKLHVSSCFTLIIQRLISWKDSNLEIEVGPHAVSSRIANIMGWTVLNHEDLNPCRVENATKD